MSPLCCSKFSHKRLYYVTVTLDSNFQLRSKHTNYEHFHNKSLLKRIHFGEEQRPLISVICLLNAHFANWNKFCLQSSWEVLHRGWQLPRRRTALGKHLPSFTLIWKDTVFILRKISVLILCYYSSGNNYNIHHVLTLKFFFSFCQESWILFKRVPTCIFHLPKGEMNYSSISSVCF